MAEEGWLRKSDVARILGVSEARVRQWAEEGRLEVQKTVLGRLYDPASVERLRSERANPR